MNDEELMKALGRTARAEPALDERWEKLAAGTLSDAERDALLEEAARSEAAAQAYEAFRPLGAEFEARGVARPLGEATHRTAAPGAEAGAPRRPAAGDDQGRPADAGAKVVQFPRRRPRFAAGPIALAASLLLAVGVLTVM